MGLIRGGHQYNNFIQSGSTIKQQAVQTPQIMMRNEIGQLQSPLAFSNDGFKTPTTEIVGIEFINPLKKGGLSRPLVPVQELNINAGTKRLAAQGATANIISGGSVSNNA